MYCIILYLESWISLTHPYHFSLYYSFVPLILGNSGASESSSVPPSSAAAAAAAYGTQGSASLHSGKSSRPKITVAQKNIDVAREKSHQKLGAMLLNARSREYERLLAEEERIRMEKQRQDLVKEKKKQDMIRFRLATEMIQGKNKR